MMGFYGKNKVSLRNSVFLKNDFSHVHQNFLDYINETPSGARILDIGTGNGYILSEIEKMAPKCYSLFGVDRSLDMIKEAKNLIGKCAILQLADNGELPFDEKCFATITAKNVTNFSSLELARVLEDEGRFIFREYGVGKGLIEIAEFFKGRLIRSRNPDFYIDCLRGAEFENIYVQTFNFAKKYTPKSLISIIQMFPFVEDLSNSDLREIEGMFRSKNEITIISDPFVLTARRKKR